MAMAKPSQDKRLGQHFLSDLNILNAIAEAADVSEADTVVEIGPGAGSLTQVLARRAARVVAIEMDHELVSFLEPRVPQNVEIRHADARRVAVEELVGSDTSYKLLGNLPYYAALPILRTFLEHPHRPTRAAILVQKEVAEQMCARPGNMSLVSLGTQLFGQPRIVRIVKPGSFVPPPKVQSAVVSINIFPQPAAGVVDTKNFFGVARAGFSAPRKQLRNSLANGLGIPAEVANGLLLTADIDPRSRAEMLSIFDWARLSTAQIPTGDEIR